MYVSSFPLRRRMVAPLLVGFGAVVAAFAAQAAPGEGGAMAACRTDLTTFCGGVEAGGGKKMRCLLDNQSKLSAECSATVKQRQERRAERAGGTVVAQASGTPGAPQAGTVAPVPGPGATAAAPAATAPGVVGPKAVGKGGKGRMAACRTDVATFCAGADKAKGGRMKCLTENKAKLSPECGAVVAEAEQARVSKKSACASEAEALCGTTKGPARRQCLETNKAKLSAQCATALEKRAAKRAEKAAGAAAPVSVPAAPAPGTPPKQ